MTTSYPLLMEAYCRDAIWGGTGIASFFRRDIPLARCAETWEISTRPEGPSHVANGPLEGCPLPEALEAFGFDAPFPLLFKLIDANDTLSVQVHPNDEAALRHGGEPKTEMWVILHAEPDAVLYVGMREGVDRKSLRMALRENRLQDCLNRIPVKTGDAVLIPGGQIHAIGAGCLLYEVQQNSNTTYRLFDWNRTDDHGQSRPLHVEQSLEAIDWNLDEPEIVKPEPSDKIRSAVIHHRYFCMDRLRIQGEKPVTLKPRPGRFLAVFAETGSVTLSGGGQSVHLPRGRNVLVHDQEFVCETKEGQAASLLVTSF